MGNVEWYGVTSKGTVPGEEAMDIDDYFWSHKVTFEEGTLAFVHIDTSLLAFVNNSDDSDDSLPGLESRE